MDDILVQLGFDIQNYDYDDKTELLYISGPALEEGVWFDSLGNTLFYPTKVIQESAPLFIDSEFVCEHKKLPIGKITNTTLNDNGFSLDGYFNNKDSINAVINKDKLGFSIAANVIFNPITNVVEKIYNVKHVALVASPACKLCGITSAYTNEGIVVMSNKKVKVGVEEPVEESVTTPADIDTTIVEYTETTVAEDAKADPPTSVPTVNNVSIKADAIVIEQPFSEVMAALSAATNTVETVSAQLSLAITNFKEMESKCSNLEVELSAKESEIESIKTEAASYKNKFEDLQKQLNIQVQNERDKLVADIKNLDPEINDNIIDSMSIVQLSAYKGSLDRFTVKGMIGGERKGFKIDEEVPGLETPVALSESKKEPSREDIAKLICDTLRKQSLSTQVI